MEEKKRKVLVTAGSTQVSIDQVRSISNIFKGGTGTNIALHFASQPHLYEVTLITSNRGLLSGRATFDLKVQGYRTFDELLHLMGEEITHLDYDIVIHSAAVSDYRVDGVCVLDESEGRPLVDIDNSKKVSSDYPVIYLRLLQTPKIIDFIREPWGFKGYLVKFKLQVGISDDELLAIARKSRIASQADMIVANCLEWARESAFVITCGQTTRRSREDLPAEIETRIRRSTQWEKE